MVTDDELLLAHRRWSGFRYKYLAPNIAFWTWLGLSASYVVHECNDLTEEQTRKVRLLVGPNWMTVLKMIAVRGDVD